MGMLIWKSLGALGLISRIAVADISIQQQPLVLDQNMYFESFNEGPGGHLVNVQLDVDYTTYGLVTIENPTNDTMSVPLNFGSTMMGNLLGADGYSFDFSTNSFNLINIAPHSTYQTTMLLAQDNYSSVLDAVGFMNADHLRAFNFSQLTYVGDTSVDIVVSNLVTAGTVTLTYEYHLPAPSTLILGGLCLLGYSITRKGK